MGCAMERSCAAGKIPVMPPSTVTLLATMRLRAGLLALLIGGLTQPAFAGETPFLGLVQTDVHGEPALPRLSALDKPPAALSVELLLDASCPAGSQTPEVLVSIASTTRAVPMHRPREATTLAVPLAQLPWLADPAARCAALDGKRPADANDAPGVRLFRLRAVTAAFATLLCPTGDGRSTSTSRALPLDSWLACPPPAEAGSR